MVIGSTSNDVAPKKTIDVEAANSGNGVMITAEPVFAPVTGDSVPIHDDTTKQSNEDKKLAEAVLPSFLKQSKARMCYMNADTMQVYVANGYMQNYIPNSWTLSGRQDNGYSKACVPPKNRKTAQQRAHRRGFA